MPADPSKQTSKVNGRLWGARAHDWAKYQEPTEIPIYEFAFQRAQIGPGTAYLDAGCGAGLAVQKAAGMGAQVSGLDASDALLAIARERVPNGNLTQGDLEELPYEDDSFAVATAFNSLQYAGNPGVALAEVRRVTRPGGFVVIATWGDPKGMEAAEVIAAVKPLLPPPPAGAPGPFALSDQQALTGFAEEAGLDPVEIFDVDAPFIYPDEATALLGLCSSGVAARAIEFAGEEAVVKAHKEAISGFASADGTYRIGATFRCLLATA